MKKLCGYCRVSTIDQKERETIEPQISSLENWANYEKKTYEIIEWYIDDGISAVKDRPEYNRMLAEIDKYDGVVIHRLDRIGRSIFQLLDLLRYLKKKNKIFICVKQKIDTSTKEGELMLFLLSAIADYELYLLKERIKEGKARYKKNGGKFGRVPIDLEKYKSRIITLYSKMGALNIVKILELDYGIKITHTTLLNRLKEWNVEIRNGNKK